MARPIRQSLAPAGVEAGTPIILNVSPRTGVTFNVGFAVDLSAGASMTYTVQHTFDDVFAPGFDGSTATWFPHPTVAGATADANGNYQSPVAAVRVSVTAWTSGTLVFTVIQQG
jgi:hypothetical protein